MKVIFWNERDAEGRIIVRDINTDEVTARLTEEEAASFFYNPCAETA